MPVTILNPYRSEPWAHAIQGLSGALEAYQRYKADDKEYKLKLEEAALRREESEQMRKLRDQDMAIREHQLSKQAEEEAIQQESEREALGESRAIAKGVTNLGDLVEETTKTGFVTPPPLGKIGASLSGMGRQPAPEAAPLESMVAPQLAPDATRAGAVAASQVATDLEAQAPSGRMSARERALGREAIADKAARKEASKQEQAQSKRDEAADKRAAARDEAAFKRQEAANEASFRRAELSAAKAAQAQAVKDEKEKFKQESTIRKEYDNVSKKPKEDLRQMERYSGAVNEKIRSGRRPSAADQYGLIYAFNKALDPSSVVRESEFMNTARVAAGYVDRAYRYYKQVVSGEMLTDRQISEMMEVINNGKEKARSEVESIENRFRDIAIQNRIDPAMIFGSTAEAARRAKENPEDPAGLDSVGGGTPSPGNPEGLRKPPARRP